MSTTSKLDLKALQANQNAAAREYWRKRLGGLEINTYFEKQGGALAGDDAGEHAEYILEAPWSIHNELETIAGSEKAKHILLLMTTGILARKCSSAEEVVLFTPVYGKELPGGLVNTLVPYRMPQLKELRLPEALGLVVKELSGDWEFVSYPLTKMLDIGDGELAELSAVGMLVEEIQLWPENGGLKPGLLFSFSVRDRLVLRLKYRQGLYDLPYAEMLAGLFFNLLSNLIRNKARLIREIELVTDEEKKQILQVWNATAKPFPEDRTVMDLFASRVNLNPDKVAIRCGGRQLTYRELDARSNQVAHYLGRLRDKGAAVAGVRMYRSPELMIALFGILKAGWTYLPLTPDYPAERTSFVLRDSGVNVVFTDGGWPEAQELGCIGVNVAEDIRDYPSSPVNLSGPDGLAYIIYTSGSTGTPKGVQILHRSIMNRLSWMQTEYQLDEQDVVLQKTPIVFDVSVWELFWWVFNGATLVLAEPGAEKDPEVINRIIRSEGVTVLHFVPSMLNVFLLYLGDRDAAQRPTTIRHLFASGEELKAADAHLFLALCPGARLHNLYGPTEATVDVSYHEVSRSGDRVRIPIGRPIDNTQLLIFNEEGNLLPAGIPGELHIGGVNLSIGYVNRPELTQSKFIKNPIEPGSLLYKTGDLARWLPDGEIEYLGRIDNQVKIRGNRIEPGEIEHVLQSFPSVANAVVLTRPSASGLQLAAFLVGGPGYSEEQLRSEMRTRLPEYMIPSIFTLIAEIPVTINGKLDRKQLLSLKTSAPKAFFPPETAMERYLAGHWERLLGRGGIGIDDSFYRIGGDSIMAVRAIASLNGEGVDLSMADFYQNDTIRKLAAFLEKAKDRAQSGDIGRVEKELEQFDTNYRGKAGNVAIEAAYPMSDIEKAMCFISRSRPDDVLYFEQIMQPIAYDELRLDLLQRALDLLVQKHEALRTGFDLDEYAHVIYKEVRQPIVFHDLSLLDADRQKRRMEENITSSRLRHFDLSKAPLWRVILYRLKNNYHEILFEYHHAIIDGWSFSSLITELNNTYALLLEDASAQVKPLAACYRDHIRQELVGKNDPETIAYWQTTLKGSRKLTINTVSSEKSFHSVREAYPEGWVEGLREAAEKRHSTVKNLLLAAYVYTMRILSCERDVCIGLVTFNRPLKEDGDKLLGCFLNTIPFRIFVQPDITWTDFVRTIDQKMIELKRHEHLSLFEINRAIGAVAYEGNPLYDTLFNFINWHIQENMVMQKMSEEVTDRIAFDSFLRGHTFFDANYNVNSERVFCMHEYSSPFMNGESFGDYTAIFNACLKEIMTAPDKVIDPYSLYWKEKRLSVNKSLDLYVAAVNELAEPAAILHEAKPLLLYLSFDGEEDPQRIIKAVSTVLSRHPILCTTIVTEQGISRQVVMNGLPDIVMGRPGGDVQQQLEWIGQPEEISFAPGEPLVRVGILPIAENRFRLCLVFHPLTADRYSVHWLEKEIVAAYETPTAVGAYSAVPGPVPYFGYRQWQRESLLKLEPYLRSKEQGSSFLTGQDIRLSTLAIEGQPYSRGELSQLLPAALVEKLTRFCGQDQASVDQVLQSAFLILLHRYTCQDQVAILSLEENRQDRRVQTAVGPFASLVIRTSRFYGDKSFGEYLAERERLLNETPEYASLPFEDDAKRYPILYHYEDTTVMDKRVAGVVIRGERQETDSFGRELYFQLTRKGGELSVTGIYDQNKLTSLAIQGLSDRYIRLLEECLEKHDIALSEIRLTNDEEAEQLLALFGRLEGEWLKQWPGLYTHEAIQPLLIAPGASLLLLDNTHQLAPFGLTGMLYIGGAAVDQILPEQSAGQQFVAHPFKEGRRLYRSGILARVGPDHHLEYLGKTDREEAPVSPAYEFESAGDEIEEQLVELWAQLLEIDKAQISIHSSFVDLGGHSIRAMLLANRLEKVFGVTVPIREIFSKGSIRQLAEYIRISSWLAEEAGGSEIKGKTEVII